MQVELPAAYSPDLVEITALASVLHSFYNGLENVFLSISKAVDADVPTLFFSPGVGRARESGGTTGQKLGSHQEITREVSEYLITRGRLVHA